MSVISEAITERNFEIVRKRIGSILADELPNQATLNGETYLNATVWDERFVPFDYTETPSVNVSVVDNSLNSYTQYDEDQTVLFNIDIYMSAKTVGAERGDVRSMNRLQRLTGVVHAILMHNRYKTLGFTPNTIIMNRHVQKMDIGEPTKTNDATSITFARLTYAVRIADGSQTPTPVVLDGYETQVVLEETTSGYLWGLGVGPTPPPTCAGVRLEINGDFIADLDSGITYNLPVLNTNSDLVGSMVGTDFIIGDTNLNVNGGLFDTFPSVTDIDLTVKDTDGLEVGSKIGTEWIVPKGGSDEIVYNRAGLTGISVIYGVNDDGTRLVNGEYIDVNITGLRAELTDFYNMKDPNQIDKDTGIVNKKRRTGMTGGYQDETDFLYYDINGVLTTKELAFPFDLCICHLTGLAWIMTNITFESTWIEALTACNDLVHAGFDDYFLPNRNEINSVMCMRKSFYTEPSFFNRSTTGFVTIQTSSTHLDEGHTANINNCVAFNNAAQFFPLSKTTTSLRGCYAFRKYYK